MAALHTISIGPEKGITLLEFSYDTDSILEINERLGPFSSDITFKYSHVRDSLSEFWNKTEKACMADCCGISAFVLWPEEIVEVVKFIDIETLVRQLERVKEQVLGSDAQIITYRRLNYNFARRSFLELMDYLLTEIKQWI
ncbi:hypothetical protein GCM10028803_15500 [Larkinella knui]|uniref:Uncharacterized protein n=1 Tax=Larkinella knui TaxID=2025310 RepID=A0A3P1C9B7_9BACT|nr:DUF6331 family protein [Larkinella knui]RRB09921.1 hypothetical protein EHT87_30850 [Larkinella knui]